MTTPPVSRQVVTTPSFSHPWTLPEFTPAGTWIGLYTMLSAVFVRLCDRDDPVHALHGQPGSVIELRDVPALAASWSLIDLNAVVLPEHLAEGGRGTAPAPLRATARATLVSW